MRLKDRFIPRDAIISSINSYEIIEEYPNDKYLPSYLVRAEFNKNIIHINMAVDFDSDYVTIITAYMPKSDKWDKELKSRRVK